MSNVISIFKETSYSFQGQEPGEKVILLLRRHPIVIILKIIGLMIAFILIFAASVVFMDFILTHNFLIPYLFVMSIFTTLIWLSIFYSLTMYTLDVWIVTDRRILDSTQHGFFNRTVSELHVTRIQDISVKTDGTLQTIIDFGDLSIQTAGTEEYFKFLQIPHPLKVKDMVMNLAFPEEHRIV